MFKSGVCELKQKLASSMEKENMGIKLTPKSRVEFRKVENGFEVMPQG